MTPLDGAPVVIVTGAATGIGRAVVNLLLEHRYTVVGMDLATSDERDGLLQLQGGHANRRGLPQYLRACIRAWTRERTGQQCRRRTSRIRCDDGQGYLEPYHCCSITAGYGDGGVPEVVVKDGSRPTRLFADDQHYVISVPKDVKVVDTIGAGDSFNGAYLAARVAGVEPLGPVTVAQQTAVIVVQHRGAIVLIAVSADPMEDKNLGG